MLCLMCYTMPVFSYYYSMILIKRETIEKQNYQLSWYIIHIHDEIETIFKKIKICMYKILYFSGTIFLTTFLFREFFWKQVSSRATNIKWTTIGIDRLGGLYSPVISQACSKYGSTYFLISLNSKITFNRAMAR